MRLKKKPQSLTVDALCGLYGRRMDDLSITKLDRETVLVEGNRRALEFLGKLFIAQAKEKDCGFQISPRGAGKRHSSKRSRFALYIHRLPCKNHRKKQ